MRRQARGLLSFPSRRWPPAEAAAARPTGRGGVTGRPACGMDRQAPNDGRAIATGRARGPARPGRRRRRKPLVLRLFLAVGSAVDGRRGGYAGRAPAPVRGYFLQRLRDRK